MDTNYFFYKKIFGNIIISKKIFSFVKFENWEDNYDQYDQIINSYGYQDATIERVLKTKQYRLFDDIVNFYFNISKYNTNKYWYCQIELNREDLEQLLAYKDLGFERFSLFFNEFTPVFLKNKDHVLYWSLPSGNIKIYNFLKFYNEQNPEIQNNKEGKQEEKPSDNIIYLSKPEYSVFKIYTFLNSLYINDSVDILKELLKLSQPLDPKLKNDIFQVILNLNQYNLIRKAFTNDDFKISEVIQELKNNLVINRDSFKLTFRDQIVNFNVLKYFWDNGIYNNTFNEGSLYTNIKIDYFNEGEILKIESSLCSITNFDTFKYLVEKKIIFKIKKLNEYLYRTIVYIARTLFDQDYLKFLLEFVSSQSTIVKNFQIPEICFDTKFPIAHHLLVCNFKPTDSRFHNAFFGDVETLKLYKKNKININYGELFSSAIQYGYTETLQYLIKVFKELFLDKVHPNLFRRKLEFSIFQLLIKNYKERLTTQSVSQGLIKRLCPDLDVLSCCKYIHFYQKVTGIQVTGAEFLLHQDRLLFEQHLQLFGDISINNGAFSLHLLKDLLYKSNYSLLKGIDLNGLHIIDTELFKKSLISNLCQYFIINQPNNAFGKIALIFEKFLPIIKENILLISNKISRYKSFKLLNFILNLNDVDWDFKKTLFMQTIFNYFSKSIFSNEKLNSLLKNIKIITNQNFDYGFDYYENNLKIFSFQQIICLFENLNCFFKLNNDLIDLNLLNLLKSLIKYCDFRILVTGHNNNIIEHKDNIKLIF
ncbi:hypothetical protein DICPUDRAFT_148613 [Dictyostelium purpureum]|uniref:Uncharacterized protein n=1 Tax=Dictyostelium purpureum TaxID=5786 RepID=F0ZBK3_DICPU|nr:uncharacterized protein DICPUDRAFT_148613 [Dictyostelium purpureum]EGC38681.1 hypothetical protein DICPUDRAFT_148613 [Dictyostelium purpureum]|eukprot:XP_003284777.1 hypothetical protein DICPUDRAFT_148613 [Dictyostelium purpureum]